MKKQAKQEMRTKTINELSFLLKQTKEELFTLLLEKSQKKLKNTSSIPRKRKDVAVVLTLIKEKKMEEK